MLTQKYARVCSWENLLLAFQKAAKGKRHNPKIAHFENSVAENLLLLQSELSGFRYQPGVYVHFYIHEPKRRKISAAPFRDRVVHHALCNIIEPVFERLFIEDSYANRKNKGTHRAIDRFQHFAQNYRYVLRADIVKHFPSIDHELLCSTLAKHLPEDDIMWLVRTIVSSGQGVLDDEYEMTWFSGDDLLAACRPRGLPIGNLSSQLWSNCYMNPFDHFIKRQLRCPAYLRYVDDFALFSNSKKELWSWKREIVNRLALMRLTLHENSAQVTSVSNGVPWLGFIVYPNQRRIKARKVHNASRHLGKIYSAYMKGAVSFAELDASVKGWVNHVRYADSWRLRTNFFNRLAAVRN